MQLHYMKYCFYYQKIISTLIFFFLEITVFASNPLVINIDKNEYKADNKNWVVEQDEYGTVYFGNDAGLLVFDGINWKLHEIAGSPIIRSLAVGSHNVIFTGGYEEFGRWDRGEYGELKYTSLSSSSSFIDLDNEDFWKIRILGEKVYFQSFKSIYLLENDEITKLDFPHHCLFLYEVKGELLIQQIGGGLYRLNNTKFEKIENSNFLSDTDVRVILPFGDNGFLVGTTKGVYIYENNVFKVWDDRFSKLMTEYELNCGLQSTSGNYYFGTILNGVYEVNAKGEIVNHISSKNNLQNNTILSIWEDENRNIWLGLDRGVSYLRKHQNIDYFIDPSSKIGALYDAVLWNEKLFLGTNQGLLYVEEDKLSHPNLFSLLKLVEGTKGQVWSLKVIEGKLYCGHNRGLKQISDRLVATDIMGVTGTYTVKEFPKDKNRYLLAGTYAGLHVFDKDDRSRSFFSKLKEPIVNIEIDELNNVWLEHANKGIYRAELSEGVDSLLRYAYYGGDSKDGLPYRMKLFKMGGKIVMLGNNSFYTYDSHTQQIIPIMSLNKCFESIKGLKSVAHLRDTMFLAIANNGIYKFSFDDNEARIVDAYDMLSDQLSLVPFYENVSLLNDSISLICLDNGFLLYKYNELNHFFDNTPNIPYISIFRTKNIDGVPTLRNIHTNLEIPFVDRSIEIIFSAKHVYAQNLSFQYMLKGVSKDWSEPQKVNSVYVPRLAEGKYEFHIRSVNSMGETSLPIVYSFEISPPWHRTVWAYLLYTLLLVVSFYCIWKWVLQRYRNIHLTRIRQREAVRLKRDNEKLKHEVDMKNAEMLTQASFIIQRNELIQKVKDIIDEFYNKNKSASLLTLQQKITALLNTKLDSEEDWKAFLIKFEEKHTDFFKKMKNLYPDLTVNDLRLCACLKLNLETKEIASLMNLSVRAVENNRYRLRKKLNIETTQNLNEFIMLID